MYARGDFAVVGRALQVISDFDRFVRRAREHGSFWPASPHLDAAFALEAALAGLARTDVDTQRASHQWLVDQAMLVRHPLGADEFECGWYWTASAGLAGRMMPELALPFLQRGIGRCPSEARLHLAYAVATDQRWPLGSCVRAMGKPPLTSPTDTTFATSRTVIGGPWRFPIRLSRHACGSRGSCSGSIGRTHRMTCCRRWALNRRIVRSVPRSAIRGKVLQALGRFDEAATALESALTTRPQAQSARVALMHVEPARNRRPASAMLAHAIQTAPVEPTVTDPWWLYWQGDYRAWSAIIANLRNSAR